MCLSHSKLPVTAHHQTRVASCGTATDTTEAEVESVVRERTYEVADDSGFHALVDPKAYDAFVGEDWTLSQLLEHFRAQMAARRLLIWGTGMENIWRVRVKRGRGDLRGFRAVSGPIVATAGTLLLTNYESLCMAAQIHQASLLGPHQKDLVIEGLSGEYMCKIVQLEDPNEREVQPCQGVDFVLELVAHEGPSDPWSEIPWSDL